MIGGDTSDMDSAIEQAIADMQRDDAGTDDRPKAT